MLTTLQYSQTRSAHTNESHVSSQPRPEVAHDEDTATEPESEPEVIELGPGDSVSQQYPSSSRPIPTNLPNSPLPIATTWVYHYTDNDDPLNIDESDPSDSESDSERELDAVHINKRPRLTKDPIPHPLASQAGASGRCSDIAPLDKPVNPRSDYAGSPRSTHVPSPRSACVTTLSQSRTAPTALTSLPTSTSSLPQPRPSDAGDLLAWATQLADLITRSRVPTSQASTSHQARQTGDPNDQLAQAPSDLRTHLTTITTTPASTSPTNTQRPPKRPRHTDLVEDNTEILELEAALTLGTHVVRFFNAVFYRTLKLITSVHAVSQTSQTSRVCDVASPHLQSQNFWSWCALGEHTKRSAHSTIGPRKRTIVSGKLKRLMLRCKRRLTRLVEL